MNVVERLSVMLTADTGQFKQGMQAAQTQLGSVGKSLSQFRLSTLANVASIAGLTMAFKSASEAAQRLDSAQGALKATAALTGQDLSALEGIAGHLQKQFKLSAITAGELTLQISKLADRAGGLEQPTRVMEAFLDIGAARGMSAAESMTAFETAIKGSARGIEQFFGRKPEALYNEFATSIGKVASALTESERAQALADAALRDGAAVRGEYADWLKSAEGRQYALKQGMESNSAVIGQLLQPALIAILPILTRLSESVARSTEGWQRFGMHLTRVAAGFRMVWAAMTRNGDKLWQAKQDWDAATEAILAHRAAAAGVGAGAPPDVLTGRGIVVPPAATVAAAGKETAERYFSALEDEWERLRHAVELRSIDLTGTDSQRLALEEQHALRLLDIERDRIHAEHELGNLNDKERDGLLGQLSIRREIAGARRQEFETVNARLAQEIAGIERQDILLQDAVARERLMAETTEQRLAAITRIYQLQRDALVADSSLTDAQLQNELLKLELAREREEISIRMLKHTAKETDHISSLASALAGMMPGGGHGGSLGRVGGSALASHMGMAGVLGNVVMPGVGGAVGAMMVGGLGKLFSKQDAEQQKQTQALLRIDSSTRTAATVLEHNRKDMEAARGSFNVPAGFSTPQYTPNSVSITVAPGAIVVNNAGQDVAAQIQSQLGPMLVKELYAFNAGPSHVRIARVDR